MLRPAAGSTPSTKFATTRTGYALRVVMQERARLQTSVRHSARFPATHDATSLGWAEVTGSHRAGTEDPLRI